MSPSDEHAQALFRRAEAAAATEGRTLGEWLYEALSEPFGFTRPYVTMAPGNPRTRKHYEAAAIAFVERVVAALPEEEPET